MSAYVISKSAGLTGSENTGALTIGPESVRRAVLITGGSVSAKAANGASAARSLAFSIIRSSRSLSMIRILALASRQ